MSEVPKDLLKSAGESRPGLVALIAELREEPRPLRMRQLRQNLQKAFDAFLGQPQHRELFGHVRSAYERRREFHFLPESVPDRVDGLAYAVKNILQSFYMLKGTYSEGAFDLEIGDADQQFLTDLQTASEKAIKDKENTLALKIFAALLASDGIDAYTAGATTIADRLKTAFTAYVKGWYFGAYSDP